GPAMELIELPGDPGSPRMNCMNSGIPPGPSSEDPGGEIAAASIPMQLACALGPFADARPPLPAIASAATATTIARMKAYFHVFVATTLTMAHLPRSEIPGIATLLNVTHRLLSIPLFGGLSRVAY